MEAVMGPGTKYVTMLRDPVDMFESAYVYYRMSAKYNLTIGRCLDCTLCVDVLRALSGFLNFKNVSKVQFHLNISL